MFCFLKNQPKDKMQNESLIVHGYLNGNLAKASFSMFSFCSPDSPPCHLPATYCKPGSLGIVNTITVKGWGKYYFIRRPLYLTNVLIDHWSNLQSALQYQLYHDTVSTNDTPLTDWSQNLLV